MKSKFYKGYTPLKDKIPVDCRRSRIDGKNHPKWYLNCNDKWGEVGGLLANDYLLFDIDDKTTNWDIFNVFMSVFSWNCHITESQGGYHVIFKRPKHTNLTFTKNREETICGIICDYKSKGGYERIKVDGKFHKVIQDCDDPDELPFLLYPLNRKLNLQQVCEGDGRHQILGSLISRMTLYCHDSQLIKQALELINTYVFAQPRKSVNWSIKDIENSISYQNSITDVSTEELVNFLDSLGLTNNEILRRFK